MGASFIHSGLGAKDVACIISLMKFLIWVGRMIFVFCLFTPAHGVAADAPAEPPKPPMHLESHPTSRWEVTLTRKRGPFHGVVYYPVPPNDPSQTILHVDLSAETKEGHIEAVHAVDAGPFKKPLLKLEINTAEPCTVTARIDVQFHDTSLKSGASLHKVKPLEPAHRKAYLDDGWPNPAARQWFRQWMAGQHLLRREGEEESAFAYRVLEVLQNQFRYVIPDDVPEFKEQVKKDPVMGDWRYTIAHHSGECWRLSDTYDRVLRMNGIPARLVSGNWVGEGTGHHVRSLIYLDGVGWVPVEATSAISSQEKPPVAFFGTWGGTMLIGNANLDYDLVGPKGHWTIGTFDSLAFASDDGQWHFPKPEFTSKRISLEGRKTAGKE
jgi:hypothetical protein